MALSPEFAEFICDQMAGFGPVEIRRMFGGGGVFADNVMLGLIIDETLYFKTDRQNEADYDHEGLPAFVYDTRDGERVIESLRLAPDRCFDDPEEMAHWARRAYEAALRADAKKPKGKRRRTSVVH